MGSLSDPGFRVSASDYRRRQDACSARLRSRIRLFRGERWPEQVEPDGHRLGGVDRGGRGLIGTGLKGRFGPTRLSA